MPALSFDKVKGAVPIAVVKGGDYDGEVLYCHPDDHKGKKPKTEIHANKYSSELRTLKPNERIQLINRLEEARRKGLTSDMLVGETALGRQLYDRILAEGTWRRS